MNFVPQKQKKNKELKYKFLRDQDTEYNILLENNAALTRTNYYLKEEKDWLTEKNGDLVLENEELRRSSFDIIL